MSILITSKVSLDTSNPIHFFIGTTNMTGVKLTDLNKTTASKPNYSTSILGNYLLSSPDIMRLNSSNQTPISKNGKRTSLTPFSWLMSTIIERYPHIDSNLNVSNELVMDILVLSLPSRSLSFYFFSQ